MYADQLFQSHAGNILTSRQKERSASLSGKPQGLSNGVSGFWQKWQEHGRQRKRHIGLPQTETSSVQRSRMCCNSSAVTSSSVASSRSILLDGFLSQRGNARTSALGPAVPLRILKQAGAFRSLGATSGEVRDEVSQGPAGSVPRPESGQSGGCGPQHD